MSEIASYKSLTKSELFDHLLNSLEDEFDITGQIAPIIPWSENLVLDGRPFSLIDHEYQRDMLTEEAPKQVFMKGAQLGMTSIAMLRTLHGLISNRYPQGSLYLFPSRADVLDFSRGRFNPLISDNEAVGRFIKDTDTMGIKRIGRSILYLRGARSTSKAGGMKRSSPQLKSVPADQVVFDELDEMESAMIDLAKERLSHSLIKEEIYLSTPSVPDFGIDKLFQQSDQRHWFIKCSKCGKETCLELEFPNCLEELSDGKVIRLCQRCKDNEVHPRDGRWVALYPDRAKDMVGWRMSQLNSAFVDPGNILKLFHDPPNGNISEVYNSKLAQAHIAAENRLTIPQILQLCGENTIAESDPGPCFLGVDVGNLIYAVIGKRDLDKAGRIVYVGAFPDWNHLDGLMKRFNVSRAVIDALPETRLAREFAQQHRGKVYLSYYSEHQKGSYAWNDREMTVTANRTEALDASHNELSECNVILPGESEALHEFAKQCSNVARVLQTDPETGSMRYIYLKTGEDHFRHAQSYECMARSFGADSIFAFSKFN